MNDVFKNKAKTTREQRKFDYASFSYPEKGESEVEIILWLS